MTPARPQQPRSDTPPTLGQTAAALPASDSSGEARGGRLAEHGGQLLFQVPFHSAMTDSDLNRLVHLLDLATHVDQKLRPSPTTLGVARLDHFSGLFLVRGDEDGQWLLEARTWDDPPPASVRQWHLRAAVAARELDPAVTLPGGADRARGEPPDQGSGEDQPVGEVLKRPLAAVRRRLAGLP